MTRPSAIIEVQPTKIATYTAMQWVGFDDDNALAWMMATYGWRSLGMKDMIRKGRVLMLLGKNNKRYPVARGEYIIALGTSGSLRVATVKEFDREYRKVSE